MSSTAIRLTFGTLLVGGAITLALAAGEPAHADDSTQHPGGVLGAVVEVVGQVPPEPTKAAEPEPAKDPEPEPTASEEPVSEHAPAEDAIGSSSEPETPPADPIGGIVEVITTPPPPVVVVPPVVAPPVVIPPVVVPTPTMPPATTTAPITTAAPDAADTQMSTPAVDTDTELADEPVPAGLPGLPVPIGPVPGRGTQITDDGIRPTEPAAPAPGEVRQCDGLEAIDLDTIRRTIRGSVDTAVTPQPDRAYRGDTRPCPSGPGGPVAQSGAMTAIAGGTTHHGDQTCGDTLARLTWPALARLHQLRARGDLPASRSSHIEPGPA